MQNQADIADWPCFSKVYQQYPLDLIPASKAVVSATLEIVNAGHSGIPGVDTPYPVFVQAFELGQGFNPQTITWNNAPPPLRNLGGACVQVVPLGLITGTQVITYNVSGPVARAYADGRPFGVMLYDSDPNQSSGEYFYSSRWTWKVEDQPRLGVQYGDPVPMRSIYLPLLLRRLSGDLDLGGLGHAHELGTTHPVNIPQ